MLSEENSVEKKRFKPGLEGRMWFEYAEMKKNISAGKQN